MGCRPVTGCTAGETKTSFDYRGIFINLDRSAERRAHIETQLESAFEEAHAGRLRLGCVFPFITTPFHPEGALPTTMVSREPDAAVSRAVLSLISYSFFIDRDLTRLPPAMTGRLAASGDEHRKLLSAVLNFVLSSPEYAPY